MSIQKIIDKVEIRKALQAHMLKPRQQKAPFLATIFTREHRPGGIIFAGVRPMSSCTDEDGETTYILTNGDSGYKTQIAKIKLSGIEYVELFC